MNKSVCPLFSSVIVAFFIVAAMVTPTPDAFTQIIVTVPMIMLYEFSILLLRVMEGKKKKE